MGTLVFAVAHTNVWEITGFDEFIIPCDVEIKIVGTQILVCGCEDLCVRKFHEESALLWGEKGMPTWWFVLERYICTFLLYSTLYIHTWHHLIISKLSTIFGIYLVFFGANLTKITLALVVCTFCTIHHTNIKQKNYNWYTHMQYHLFFFVIVISNKREDYIELLNWNAVMYL